MDTIEKLSKLFARFPGIGERQAKRFVYFMLNADETYVRELLEEIGTLKKQVSRCPSCFSYSEILKNGLCRFCADETADKTTLLVVEKDADMERMKKSASYKGMYFALGALVPISTKEGEMRARVMELVKKIENMAKPERLNDASRSGGNELKEIILAFSMTAEGDHTDLFIREKLRPLAEKYTIKISSLGRGLSTGTELEYSDSDTLINALKNRN